MDYFARDERRTEKGNGEVDHRLIEEAVVAWGECPRPNHCFQCKGQTGKHLMITWPEKCVGQICNFFHRRFRNHSNVYQHKTTQASTYMIADVLVLADPFYRIKVVDDLLDQKPLYPTGLPISRAMVDPKSYLRLRDSIIDQIETTDDIHLKDARLLIQRLRNRDFYKRAAVLKIHSENETHLAIFRLEECQIAQALVEVGHHVDASGKIVNKLEVNDFIVEKSILHMGRKEIHPIRQMRLVPKGQEFKIYRPIEQLPIAVQVDERDHEVSIPRSCVQRSIQIFCKTTAKHDLLAHAFEQFCAVQEDKVLENVVNTADDALAKNNIVHAYSQVSQEAWETPGKSPPLLSTQPEEQSPVPFPRRHFAFAGAPVTANKK